MYIDIGLFAKAEYLALFRTRFNLRRWGYIFFFTALYWLMWLLVAFGRALDRILFPGYKRELVREPVFIVAPPRTGSTLTQKLMSLDEERFVYNSLYQTIFPAVTFQRCFDALVSFDRIIGQPFGRIVGWAEKKLFGGWDEMHKLRFNQPEEDDGFFVYTFVTEAIFLLFLRVDELWEAGFLDALAPTKRRKVMAFYRSCLQRRLYASGTKKTILCKATQASGSVESLLEEFPDAKFITIVRDPCESVASHVSVFWPVWRAHSPALKKDGPESKAYARLAVRWFQHLFAFRNKVDSKQYFCIDYRDLTRDPKGTLEKVYRHFGWTISDSFREKLSLASGEQHQFTSKHKYFLEEFGLTKAWIQAELGPLLDYYALNGSSDHQSTRSSIAHPLLCPEKAPPRYVQQSKGDEQEPVPDDGRSDLRSVEALNGYQQSESNVAIARPERHHLPGATIGRAHPPTEKQ
jgi:hypothetical protein